MDAAICDVSRGGRGRSMKNSAWGFAAPHFLEGFLMPRHRVDSLDAPWVYCLGCDIATLGAGFHVLSDGGNGVMFGRSSG